MATFTVKTESYVDLPEGSTQEQAEVVVRDALEAEPEIYLVKSEWISLLVDR